MAIRDRFRRAMHKNDSDSNISQTESNTTSATNTSSEASSLHKQPTNASSTTPKLKFPWSVSDKEKEARQQEKETKKKAAAKKKKGPIHPRDRELTAANLRNQEMLSGFDFSFGSSPNRLSQLVPHGPDDTGVSPCCTRPASINGDFEAPDLSPVDEIAEIRHRSSTADLPPNGLGGTVPA